MSDAPVPVTLTLVSEAGVIGSRIFSDTGKDAAGECLSRRFIESDRGRGIDIEIDWVHGKALCRRYVTATIRCSKVHGEAWDSVVVACINDRVISSRMSIIRLGIQRHGKLAIFDVIVSTPLAPVVSDAPVPGQTLTLVSEAGVIGSRIFSDTGKDAAGECLSAASLIVIAEEGLTYRSTGLTVKL